MGVYPILIFLTIELYARHVYKSNNIAFQINRINLPTYTHNDTNTNISTVFDDDSGVRPRVSMEYMPENDKLDGEVVPLTNLLLIVSYDGTNFGGWNGRPLGAINNSEEGRKLDSVSNTLLKPLLILHGFNITDKYVDGGGYESQNDGDNNVIDPKTINFSLAGASRTDKGVHAREMACQYKSFTKSPPCDGDLLLIHSRINRMIPQSIRVNSILHVNDPKFNVMVDNIGKIYTYRLSLNASSPFDRYYSWHLNSDHSLIKQDSVGMEFDPEKAKMALNTFLGRHDFTNFKNAYKGNEKNRPVDPFCTIERAEIVKSDNGYQILIKGDRFLYKMVRYIVSHVVYAALGLIPDNYIEQLLLGGPKTKHIDPAPSQGLELTRVIFPRDVESSIQSSIASFDSNIKKIY